MGGMVTGGGGPSPTTGKREYYAVVDGRAPVGDKAKEQRKRRDCLELAIRAMRSREYTAEYEAVTSSRPPIHEEAIDLAEKFREYLETGAEE